VGPYRPLERRCLTATELTARGWSPNATGYWRKAALAGAFDWKRTTAA
jgi:hypothetical protein